MPGLMSRRNLLAQLALAATSIMALRSRPSAQTKIPFVVHKDPNCGCCHLWVNHMNANGFLASVKDTGDVNAIKRARGVAQSLWSCHTSLIDGYVIEGHVPASDVKKLLAQRPKGVVGLALPGMPASAPGMDMKPFKPFTVLSFDSQGRTSVFATHDRAG